MGAILENFKSDGFKQKQREKLKKELKKIARACFNSEKEAWKALYYKNKPEYLNEADEEDDKYNDNLPSAEADTKACRKYIETMKKKVGKRSRIEPDKLEKYIDLLLTTDEAKSYTFSQEVIKLLPTVIALENQVRSLRDLCTVSSNNIYKITIRKLCLLRKGKLKVKDIRLNADGFKLN